MSGSWSRMLFLLCRGVWGNIFARSFFERSGFFGLSDSTEMLEWDNLGEFKSPLTEEKGT